MRIVTFISAILVAGSLGLGSAQTQSKSHRTAGILTADTRVYLVAAPSPARRPLKTVPAGTPVRVLDEENGWIKIDFFDDVYGNRIGWIDRRSVRIMPAEPPPAPQRVAALPPVPAPSTPAAASPMRPAESQLVKTPVATAEATPPAAQPQPPRGTPAPAAAPGGKPAPVKLRNVRIRGYVTSVASPVAFEIEDYRIQRPETFALDFENAAPDIQFGLQDIRVGVELEIRGLLDESTGDLKAQSIKVDLEQFRTQKVTAIVSAPPVGLVRESAGWSGQFYGDGQTIEVTPATQVVFKPTSREKRDLGKSGPDVTFEPLSSLEQIDTGMLLTYEGTRDRTSGHILAKRIEFSRNDLEDGEARLRQSLKTSVKPAQGFTPGELKIDRVGKFKLLNSAAVQDYVRGIAMRLVPAYQAALPEGDPRKIPFQVHVVENEAFNAHATANGIIIVNTGLIALLENEAQLAAVLGHEVVHATHEHTWRGMQADKKKRVGLQIASVVAAGFGQYDLSDVLSMIEGAIRNGYGRGLENQADRVGLQAMVTAGYDPRQAPTVWKLVSSKYGDGPTNVFWSTHENNATRRSYLMNELKNNYRDLDYGSLKTNAGEYTAMKAAMFEAHSSRKKLKIK
ncbi:MAG TPA: M48 family metalloprotease [Vicinamibacterales bacterium]|nr:M48 family metalloprotease [Vicinamibacterales bacterium]